jgi:hypothetical protein
MYKIARKAVLVSLWAFSLAQGAAAVECVDGLYMIVARGTGEPYDTAGDLERVAKRVAERIDGSAISPVHYPATFTNPWHVESIRDGAIDARAKITEYAKSCPGKIALLGYSQVCPESMKLKIELTKNVVGRSSHWQRCLWRQSWGRGCC